MLLGSHVGLHDVMGAAEAVGADVVQVHLSAPLQWRDPLHRKDFGAWRVPVYVHAPYLANPVSSSRGIRERSVASLRAQLAEAARVGARGVVVHAGQAGPDATQRQAAQRWLRGLDRLGGLPVPLLVENTASGRCAPGRALDDLHALFSALSDAGFVGDGRVGFCLDTCHAWAAGWDPASMARDAVGATGRLDLVHLNDCRGGRGAGLDRHENLGAGEIGWDSLVHVSREADALGCPAAVLEVPGGVDVVRRDLLRLKRELERRA